MLNLLFQWPDLLAATPLPAAPLEQAAYHIRLANYLQAEAILIPLCDNPQSPEPLALLAILASIRAQHQHAAQLLAQLQSSWPDSPHTNLIFAHINLQQQNLNILHDQPASFWCSTNPSVNEALSYAKIKLELQSNNLHIADKLLAPYLINPTLVASRLQALYYQLSLDYPSAIKILESIVARAPKNRALQSQYIELLLTTRDGIRTIPALRFALAHCGDHPDFLGAVTAVKLLQRQPGFARRSALIEQISSSITPRKVRLSNLFVAYEQCGHANWANYVHPSVYLNPLQHPELHGNLSLQLASTASNQAVPQAQAYCTALSTITPIADNPSYIDKLNALLSAPNKPLRIGWLTGDVSNHPVARFLHGFFNASIGALNHSHQLISMQHHGNEGWDKYFDALPNLDFISLGSYSPEIRYSQLTNLNLDIAIDLSGWTGGHSLQLFQARFAPIQISYLGYFASTGVPNMDYWLADNHLFPSPPIEPHSEKLFRLQRCFIAWQPTDILPEYHTLISDPPKADIRLGCFNHNRKFSDFTLSLWGELLNAIPAAKLVLKANSTDDPHTQILLRRRMLRAGLDPERVEWLPITASAQEHLIQYSQLDLALDCHPNGGCTTTCEALWMGVPTLSLMGDRYVSRMATAVLTGANLPQFITATRQQYLERGTAIAADLHNLRSKRNSWRAQIQASPLGDARDLMQHLENAFSLIASSPSK